MTITVVDDRSEFDVTPLEAFAQAVLDAEGVDADTSVTIRFVSDETIAELNEEYMGVEGPTDVLAFPIEAATPGAPPKRQIGGPPLDLGDIFISTNVVRKHADEYGVEFTVELHLMVCHGLLHLLGWDHVTDEEAARMEQREAEHLAVVDMVRR